MKRRVYFLRNHSRSGQRTRVVHVSRLMHEAGWSCSSGDHPRLDRYDIVWALEPSLAHTLYSVQYRLLVWDQVPALSTTTDEDRVLRDVGATILGHCAGLMLLPGQEPQFSEECVAGSDLDVQLAREFAEDVIEILRKVEGE